MTKTEKDFWNLVAYKFVEEYGYLAKDEDEAVYMFEQIIGEELERRSNC